MDMTTDSASNMRADVNLMGVPKLRCVAHKNHTLVTKALKETKAAALMDKVKAIVEYFNRYTTASAKLTMRRQKLGEAATKPCQGVAPSWNSDYKMLIRFLEMETTLRPLIIDLPKCPPETRWLPSGVSQKY